MLGKLWDMMCLLHLKSELLNLQPAGQIQSRGPVSSVLQGPSWVLKSGGKGAVILLPCYRISEPSLLQALHVGSAQAQCAGLDGGSTRPQDLTLVWAAGRVQFWPPGTQSWHCPLLPSLCQPSPSIQGVGRGGECWDPGPHTTHLAQGAKRLRTISLNHSIASLLQC